MAQPGQWVKAQPGYSAFVPNPLPPDLDWTREIVHAPSDADRAIGRLAGDGRALPNPHILMRPFIAREAVLSSRIEGRGRRSANSSRRRQERWWIAAPRT
jgi:Fic family protein